MATKKKAAASSTALVKMADVKLEDFAIARFDPVEFKATMEENLGGEALSPRDLMRVKIPSGGGTHWTVPSLDDPDGVPQKQVSGVVVAHRTARAYWEKDLDDGGGGSPPDCFSVGGAMGHGNPGGKCADCPLAQFGSKAKGNGQACKQMKEIYILQDDKVLPIVIALPPTSLKNFRQYATGLTTSGEGLSSRLTTFTLAKASNDAGIAYSRAEQEGAKLDDDMRKRMKQYSDDFKVMIGGMAPVDFRDHSEGME